MKRVIIFTSSDLRHKAFVKIKDHTLKIAKALNTVGLITQIGLLNPFNRKQESEADYLGMIFSSLSGYDIRETVKIWERMKKLNKGKEPPEFMSTHPSSDNRIKDLNDKMNEVILDCN